MKPSTVLVVMGVLITLGLLQYLFFVPEDIQLANNSSTNTNKSNNNNDGY
jgi:hypothetical protein